MAKPPAPKAPKPVKAPAPKDRPHVEHGDEIYFHHEGEPYAGKVVAHGEHGATLELKSGKSHKMRWENYVAHRSRVQPELSIIDQGEDGFVAHDRSSGRARFVHDPLDEDAVGESMAKAFEPSNAIERILLMRAGQQSVLEKAIRKNAPGLSLQDVTRKDGTRTKAWKRTGPEEKHPRQAAAPKPASSGPPPGHHDAKAGQTVKFKAGDFHGTGKIVGEPGADGAHVQDSSGRQHQVRWDEIHERTPESKGPRLVVPTGKPAKAASSAPKAASSEAKAPSAAPAGGGGDGKDESARREGETDKQYAKRVVDHEPSPEHIPENHDDYFHTKDSHSMPVANLVSAKSDEENQQGGDNGPKRMRAAAEGRLDKREPIKVTPNADGKTHTVLDGNGTFTSVKKYGWKNIPVMVVHPVDTKDEVMSGAKVATEYLKDWLNNGSGLTDKWGGYETQKRGPDQVSKEEYAQPGGMLFIAPPKKESAAEEKVQGEYKGDWSRLKDAARCTIAVDSIAEVHDVVAKLKASGMVVAQPMKDRYNNKATPVGYRDINMIIRTPNGFLAEVQVNTKTMISAKEHEGHKDYEITRGIERKYGEGVKPEAWTPEDQADHLAATDRQTKTYAEAYKKLVG